MKLYELERGRWFRVKEKEGLSRERFQLEKIDGMYSRCLDVYGNLLHISAAAPIQEVGDEEFPEEGHVEES